jgi:hypothetical protein
VKTCFHYTCTAPHHALYASPFPIFRFPPVASSHAPNKCAAISGTPSFFLTLAITNGPPSRCAVASRALGLEKKKVSRDRDLYEQTVVQDSGRTVH